MARRFLLALILLTDLACSGARRTSVAQPLQLEMATSSPEDAVAGPVAEAFRSCRVLEGEGGETVSFDAHGLPASRVAGSDQAGTRYEERYERDARGRVVRIHRTRLERGGDERALPDVIVTYTEDAARFAVEARFVAPDEDERVVRWTYDDRGYPARRETRSGSTAPPPFDCHFDARGRVVGAGEATFDYLGDQLISRTVRGYTERFLHFEDVLAHPGSDHSFEVWSEDTQWRGDCADVLFEGCSPAFAPPPPGGERRSLPRPPAPRAWPSSADVAKHELACEHLPFDDEQERSEEEEVRNRADSCEVRTLLEASTPRPAAGRILGVEVLQLRRGDQFEESYYLVTHVAEGWRLGPQLSDGPFVGNQMVGTLSVELAGASIRQLIPGGEPEFSVHYELETAHSDDDGDRSIHERGFMICRDLATPDMRCVRVREYLREQSDDGEVEASAELRFGDDGTLELRDPRGDDPRVPTEGGAVDEFFF